MNLIELPTKIKDTLIYLDNDGDLSYCFPEPTESPFYPGYFYIPGYSRYVINRQGDLLVVRTGRSIKWYKTKATAKSVGGYFIANINADNGKRNALGRHRALLLAFKHPKIHPGNLHVNHLDGKPGNDVFDNLEWSTQSENVLHAYRNGLYPNKTVKIDVWNWKTGFIGHYPSIQQFVEEHNYEHNKVIYRIRNNEHYSNGRKYSDGWRFKKPNEPWVVLDAHIEEDKQKVEVIARDVFTGKPIIFGSIEEAAQETKCHPGAIRVQIVDNLMLPLRGWNFRKLSEFEGWPQYTEKHLEIFRKHPIRPGDGIEVYDCNNNSMMFFTSAEEAAAEFNISPVTVSKLARYEKQRGQFKFKLFRIRDLTISPPTE